MFKSAIINNSSDPSLNINLGCNLKHKPRSYREEDFVTAEFFRSRNRTEFWRTKEIGIGRNCVFLGSVDKLVYIAKKLLFLVKAVE